MKVKKTLASSAVMLIKIALIVLVIVVVYKLTFKAYDFGYRIFADTAIDSEPGITRAVSIADGLSAKEIGKILEDRALIKDATLFILQERFSEYHDKIKPGQYELSTAMTPYEMMDIMSREPVEETQEQEDVPQITEAQMEADEAGENAANPEDEGEEPKE